LKPNDIFFFLICHFWKLDHHFPSSLKACPSLSVLSLSPLHHFPVHLQWFATPKFPLTEVPPLPHFQGLSKSLSFTLPPTHTPLLL
jgi:hypothetical protein